MSEEKAAIGKRSLWSCGSQFQQITKGMIECPKCFGACELDLTPRDMTGWPLSPCTRTTCDHCDGEGEVKPEFGAKPNAEPEPAPVTGWGDYKAPERIVEPIANKGWATYPV
jgi:hypothetical protein